MTPWETLDRAEAPDGTALTLVRHGGDFAIRAGGHALMGSRMHASEDALGARGCEGLRARRGARVLIGGLGMGFTLRAALDALAPDARVEVAELVPAVVRWNLTHLAHLAGRPLDDPRARVIEADVADVIAGARGAYDAVLLDVDNGPSAITAASNARLYGAAGLARAARALREGATLAVWSAGEDRGFTARLVAAGFEARTERARARAEGGGWHVLWLAKRRATP